MFDKLKFELFGKAVHFLRNTSTSSSNVISSILRFLISASFNASSWAFRFRSLAAASSLSLVAFCWAKLSLYRRDELRQYFIIIIMTLSGLTKSSRYIRL